VSGDVDALPPPAIRVGLADAPRVAALLAALTSPPPRAGRAATGDAEAPAARSVPGWDAWSGGGVWAVPAPGSVSLGSGENPIRPAASATSQAASRRPRVAAASRTA
jgi:hypothetical protein